MPNFTLSLLLHTVHGKTTPSVSMLVSGQLASKMAADRRVRAWVAVLCVLLAIVLELLRQVFLELVASVSDAPLPCEMEVCFCGTLEPNAYALGCSQVLTRQVCGHQQNCARMRRCHVYTYLHRETERQRDRDSERQRDRETERQRDRETERQKEQMTNSQTTDKQQTMKKHTNDLQRTGNKRQKINTHENKTLRTQCKHGVAFSIT